MAKTLTIEIKSMEHAFEGFRKTFKALAAGRRVARHEGVYFTSIEAARNLLTRNRLALLRTIRTRHPGSIYELAKTVKRDLKNVQQDLRILEEYGLIRMTPARRGGKRLVKVPEAPFDEIALRIAI
ncbi:MAG: ArsR family transcriptional regulator [Candidatus Rokubacteria bacterium]|nr:ArsR family transcriptional regulator [Candidatus Rokubacteria bacterium]